MKSERDVRHATATAGTDTRGMTKTVSGKYNGVYKGPRALYTKMSESFIYFQTTGKIEVKYE